MKIKCSYLAIAVFVILIAASIIASPAAGRVGANVENPVSDSTLYTGCGGINIPSENAGYEQQVIDLVNQERSKVGLPPLTHSEQLEQAARYHAVDMAQDNYFDHNTYNPGNPNPVCQWFERVGGYYPGYSSLGENIALGYQTPEQVVEGWMNSPDHRANILSKDIWEIGVGYAVQMTSDGAYWVQDFGKRANTPSFKVKIFLPQVER